MEQNLVGETGDSRLAVVWFWWTKRPLESGTQLQVQFHSERIQFVRSEGCSAVQTKSWGRLRDLLHKHATDQNKRAAVDTPADDQTSDQFIFFSLACPEDSYCHTYTQMDSHKQITQTLCCSCNANKEEKSRCSVFKYLGVAQSGNGNCMVFTAVDKIQDLILFYPFSFWSV